MSSLIPLVCVLHLSLQVVEAMSRKCEPPFSLPQYRTACQFQRHAMSLIELLLKPDYLPLVAQSTDSRSVSDLAQNLAHALNACLQFHAKASDLFSQDDYKASPAEFLLNDDGAPAHLVKGLDSGKSCHKKQVRVESLILFLYSSMNS